MIRYKKYQSKRNGVYYGKWYARAAATETLDLEGLAEHIASHGSPYSEGTINGVLTDMVDCVRELVLDGKQVKIPDLALFSLGIESRPADTAEEWTAKGNISRVYLKARGTGDFNTAKIKAAAKFKEADEYGTDDDGDDSEE